MPLLALAARGVDVDDWMEPSQVAFAAGTCSHFHLDPRRRHTAIGSVQRFGEKGKRGRVLGLRENIPGHHPG